MPSSSPFAPSKGLERQLRLWCIYTFIPAFALNLFHGIIASSPFPAVGLVPQFGSMILSFYLFGCMNSFKKRMNSHEYNIILSSNDDDDRKAALRRKLWVAALDLLFAFLLILFIFLGLVDMGSNWSGGLYAVFGTYATVPLWINA
jgi:hypothetical protein